MPGEPEWSKNISNSSVCTWFYALALLNAFFAVAGIVGLIVSKRSSMVSLLPLLISAILGFTNSWFLFLVCNRGLSS